jgi:hypothetical protein
MKSLLTKRLFVDLLIPYFCLGAPKMSSASPPIPVANSIVRALGLVFHSGLDFYDECA